MLVADDAQTEDFGGGGHLLMVWNFHNGFIWFYFFGLI
jgi:hypothetical protein